MEAVFAFLIIAQFLVVALHDWVTVPGLASGRQVQSVIGRRRLALATAINSIFPGVAAAYAVGFFHSAKPGYVHWYWLMYTAIAAASAFLMWWVPYLFGAPAEHRQLYGDLYRGTKFVLPVRRGDPGPNLLHIIFHGLFLSTFVLALVQLR